MQFRVFDPSADLSEVLSLFRQGLSRTGNQEWFNWKHRENPFGPSPGFLAEQDGKIVAARFFLRWRFRNAQGTTNAIRPVDTVVHPSARRQGIFSRLTLYGLEQLSATAPLPVFNTPNNNSLPGYLKMGWEVYGEPLPYCYRLAIPLGSVPAVSIADRYPESIAPDFPVTERYRTDLSTEFLRWRYAGPNYRFAYFRESAHALLVYRLLSVRGLPVLSVSDYAGPPDAQKDLTLAAARRENCFVVHTLADSPEWPAGNDGLRLRKGSSLVAVRADKTFTGPGLAFSPGDLEDVL